MCPLDLVFSNYITASGLQPLSCQIIFMLKELYINLAIAIIILFLFRATLRMKNTYEVYTIIFKMLPV